MLPEQQAAQLYGVGRLVQSVRLQLQLQWEQFLHPGQLKWEKQSSVTNTYHGDVILNLAEIIFVLFLVLLKIKKALKNYILLNTN